MAFVLSLFAGRLVLQGGTRTATHWRPARRTRSRSCCASRGAILDRNGVPLSVSEDAVAITADPTQTQPVAQQLAAILAPKLTSTTSAKLLAAMTGKTALRAAGPPGQPADLERHRGRAEGEERPDRAAEQGQAARPAGAAAGRDLHRGRPDPQPPNGTIAANVVGVVGDDGKGLSGLEYGMNDKLSGQDGKAMYEVDTKGNKIPNANHTVEEASLTAQLTLDADLQWFAEKRIEQAVKQYQGHLRHGDHDGREVRRDPGDGELPDLRPEQQEAQVQRPEQPALERTYEPGSVQKVVTMAALADAGLIDLNTKLRVPGSIEVQRRTIKDHWDHGT